MSTNPHSILTASAGYASADSLWVEYEYLKGEKNIVLRVHRPLEDFNEWLGGRISDGSKLKHCKPSKWLKYATHEETGAYAKTLPEWVAFKALIEIA